MTSSAPYSPLGLSAHGHKELCQLQEMVVLSLLGDARQVASLLCA